MRIGPSISAIVTGGASGLGLASVRALRDAGARVAIFDINREAGAAAAAATGAVFCQADVLSEDGLDAAFAQARAENGVARILVACAGGGNAISTIRKHKESGEISRFPTADFAKVVMLNAVGTFAAITRFAADAAGLEMVDDERGVIVMTASVAGQDGQQGQAAYSAGKAAIIGMTLPIARDLSRFAIRINSILPGTFDTPMLRGMNAEKLAALGASVPFPKRMGRPEEYASLVLELCRNGYFNGEAIRLDGAVRFAPR